MDQEGEASTCLERKFLHLNSAKIKEGIFVGQQISALFKDEIFNRVIEENGNAAWTVFKFDVDSFWNNQRAETCDGNC